MEVPGENAVARNKEGSLRSCFHQLQIALEVKASRGRSRAPLAFLARPIISTPGRTQGSSLLRLQG